MEPEGSKTNSAGRLPAALAAVGLFLSVALQVIHVRTFIDPKAGSFCAVDETFDCVSVALSKWSVVLGVPTAFWGIVGFALMYWAATSRRALLLPLALLSAVATTALLLVELLQIGAICMICEGAHLTSLALAFVAWRRRDLAETRAYFTDFKQVARDLVWPAVLPLAVALFVPPYWVMATWKSGPRLPHGVTEEGHPWIGAENPDVVIHEFVDYSCPHCAVATGLMRLRVGENPRKYRLVRHHLPRTRCIPANPGGYRCRYVRAAKCAGEQDKFWEMDDWLFHHVPGRTTKFDAAAAAAEVGVDAEALQACMDKPEMFERAHAEVKYAAEHKVRYAPMYIVDGEVLKGEPALKEKLKQY